MHILLAQETHALIWHTSKSVVVVMFACMVLLRISSSLHSGVRSLVVLPSCIYLYIVQRKVHNVMCVFIHLECVVLPPLTNAITL